MEKKDIVHLSSLVLQKLLVVAQKDTRGRFINKTASGAAKKAFTDLVELNVEENGFFTTQK